MKRETLTSFPQIGLLPVPVARLGLVSRIFSGGTPDKSKVEYWEGGQLPWIGSGEVNQLLVKEPTAYITSEAVAASATKLMPAGSLIMALAGQGKTKGMVAQMALDAYGNQSLACIASFRGSTRFLFWWLTSLYRQVRALSSEDTRDGLNQSILGRLPVPQFPVEAQTRIADFLDRETARIDQLIEKKERLIEKLSERSAALIASNVQEGGPVTKLAHHTRILPGYAFPSSDFSEDPTNIRLLRGVNVTPGNLRWDDVVYWPHNRAAEVSRFELKVGDVVMGMDRPWISSGIRVARVTEQDVPCFLLQRVCKIDPLSSLDKHYLLLLLNSRQFLAHFEPILTGVSVPHISSDQIQAFRFPYVSLDVQRNRAKSCRNSLNQNRALTEHISASIERLQELRASLIAAAVTGQLDVSRWIRGGVTERGIEAIETGVPA